MAEPDGIVRIMSLALNVLNLRKAQIVTETTEQTAEAACEDKCEEHIKALVKTAHGDRTCDQEYESGQVLAYTQALAKHAAASNVAKALVEQAEADFWYEVEAYVRDVRSSAPVAQPTSEDLS